jgi:hypothetical protein
VSVYVCNRCDHFYSDDDHGCVQDPKDKCGLLCLGCAAVCSECGGPCEEPGMCEECAESEREAV